MTDPRLEVMAERFAAVTGAPRAGRFEYTMARAALAAADKAATITTVEGLGALPVRSIVQGWDGFRHEKRTEGWLMVVNQEVSDHHANEIELPARVLHYGDPR